MGEAKNGAFPVGFDSKIRLEFHGAIIVASGAPFKKPGGWESFGALDLRCGG